MVRTGFNALLASPAILGVIYAGVLVKGQDNLTDYAIRA
jgi:hypothetical protein